MDDFDYSSETAQRLAILRDLVEDLFNFDNRAIIIAAILISDAIERLAYEVKHKDDPDG